MLSGVGMGKYEESLLSPGVVIVSEVEDPIKDVGNDEE
jgi:hypothetical protein